MKYIFKVLFFPFNFTYYKIKRVHLKAQLKKISIQSVDSLNGYEFEKFVSNVFFAHGYHTAVTKKGADKGVDVVAKKRGKTLVVQTKMYYNHNVSNSAVQQIYTAKKFYNAHLAIVVTNWYFTKHATELADKLNVVLIDRSELIEILNGKRLKFLLNIASYNDKKG